MVDPPDEHDRLLRLRLVRGYPTRTAVRALYLGAYAGAAVTCGVFLPWLLVPFGIVAFIGALAGLWLMRPGSGRGKGLPPGALSLVPVRQTVDEAFLTRLIARHGPVCRYKRLLTEALTDTVVEARVGDFEAAVRGELAGIAAGSEAPQPMLPRAARTEESRSLGWWNPRFERVRELLEAGTMP